MIFFKIINAYCKLFKVRWDIFNLVVKFFIPLEIGIIAINIIYCEINN